VRERVVLVDDHQIFREALRGLLEKTEYLEVVGEAGDSQEAIRQVFELMPDIVCMDIGLPGANGIDVTRQLKTTFPKLKIIALSAYCDHVYVVDAMKAGATAYVAKADGANELVRAIQSALLDQQYLSSSISDLVTRKMFVEREVVGASLLGERECQVLRLVASGRSTKQIAVELKIAPGTVDVHRRNIMRKLNMHSAVELTHYAINSGLIDF
jgi:DNA-binding NarL/FixJ family response regulator